MRSIINEILGRGGHFVGGFVRDYLIRGEAFSDIDFVLPQEENLGISLSKKTQTHAEFNFDNTTFHWQYSAFQTDLSCNFFHYSSDGIVAKPTKINYSYEHSFELIKEKRFVYFTQNDMRIRHKMVCRGWIMTDSLHKQIRPTLHAPKHGSWEALNQIAKQRIDALDTPPLI